MCISSDICFRKHFNIYIEIEKLNLFVMNVLVYWMQAKRASHTKREGGVICQVEGFRY